MNPPETTPPPLMNELTFSLSSIASEANREHKLATDAACSALEHACRCGELLTQAKSEVGHGKFLPWLKANFAGSERTAQNYMRLASNPQRVADLGCDSIRAAIEALTDRPEPDLEAMTRDARAKMELMIDGAIELAEAIKKDPRFREFIGEEKYNWGLWYIDTCTLLCSEDDGVRLSAIERIMASAESEIARR
jgi:hypothetical protein